VYALLAKAPYRRPAHHRGADRFSSAIFSDFFFSCLLPQKRFY